MSLPADSYLVIPAELGARICTECGEPIDSLEEPHAAHEHDCPVNPLSEDWACWCDGWAHVACCRYCAEMRDVIETVSA